MTGPLRPRRGPGVVALIAGLGLAVSACNLRKVGPRLEKSDDEVIAIPDVPVPAENGPRLGAVANRTPIFDRPSRRGASLGALHAGATVVRAAEPFSTRGCDGGWFPIRPRGFVCASESATTDLRHPTLVAMGIQPGFDGALPYAYARAIRDTNVFAPDAGREDGVHPIAQMRAKSGAAIVGSWNAKDPEGKLLRLALLSDGRFLPAADLEAVSGSAFHGIELGKEHTLPLAFVVKRGVREWTFRGDTPEKGDLVEYHRSLELTGRSRTKDGVEFWATREGRYVRLRDVTLVRERNELPGFASGDQKWMDVSVVTGTLVAYEGRTPVFATLVSAGRDRLAPAEGATETNVTQRGELEIVGKQITALGRDADTLAENVSIYDAPWVMELASGQMLLGAYWHDRFGIEHGPGNLELAPSDAARLFKWSDPPLPEGWHAVTTPKAGKKTIVNVRK